MSDVFETHFNMKAYKIYMVWVGSVGLQKINSALQTSLGEQTWEGESEKSYSNMKTSEASVSICFFLESILNL